MGDDLSELQSEAVPEEVRKWLASTFAKQETAPRRRGPDERPTFRSVANAIRTGIFIEKIYRRMSSSQLMAIPPDVHHALKVCNYVPTYLCTLYDCTYLIRTKVCTVSSLMIVINSFSKFENIV